jgi:crotonobetainyl-CoA:carnitine CoA-transferase CaiB-like acyl-CoA transferase
VSSSPGPLSPYRVLDLTDERGLACGHFLGALGADVIQVEPPGGSSARRVGPFAGGVADAERSLLWWAYARHKRGIVLDLDADSDRARLLDLVRGADFFIESAAPGELERRGLGYERLAAINPALVYVSITPFGPDGPKAHWAATDLVVQASAGAMILSGHPDRAPLRTGGVSAFTHAGAEAAGAALIAHHERVRSGRGQHVQVSAQIAANLAAGFTWIASQIGHPAQKRSGGGVALGSVRLPWIWRVADGEVSLTLGFDGPSAGFFERFLDWMLEEGALDRESRSRKWADDVRAVVAGTTPANDLVSLFDRIAAFLRGRTKAQLLAATLQRSLLMVPVATTPDVLASAQFEARGFWVEHDRPDAADVTLRYPGAFARFSGTPMPRGHRAPAIGEHTAEVGAASSVGAELASARGGSGQAAPLHPSRPTPSSPLDDVRILDFSWVMAGPWTTRVLADYGATVVKVESMKRPDLVRFLPPFHRGLPGVENSAGFWSINAGKRSLALDLGHPEARRVVLDLVRWADVVLESFSPRAMRNWGWDYASLAAIKPDLIMVSTCLFGQTGPLSSMAGYGTMGAALGGLVAPTGWPDRPPCGPFGPYTDFIAPRFTVAAILAAIDDRRRTGEGQHIDQSQVEGALQFIAPHLLDAQVNGRALDRVANDDPAMAPHGVYATAGDDEWVAIAARDDRDWRALCRAIDRSDLAGDPRFATLDGRRRHRDLIDSELSAWTTSRAGAEVETRLQNAGVPAHAVLGTVAASGDPQVLHRRHFLRVPHGEHGEVPVESSRAELSRTPARVTRAGPVLGEDTDFVLRELLGYEPSEVQRLRASGALR